MSQIYDTGSSINYAFPEMLRRFCQPIVSDTFWSGAREPEYRTKSSDMCEQMVKLHDGNGLEKIDNAAPSFTISKLFIYVVK